MKLARQNDIVAIRTATGRVVGFHAHNLQVAELTESVWSALSGPVDGGTSLSGAAAATAGALATGAAAPSADDIADDIAEAREELLAWNLERDDATTDAVLAKGIRSFAINVAQICNLKCTYCAAGGDGTFGDPSKEIDLGILYDQIRMFLHDTPNGGEFKFVFLGGEPLLAADAIRVIARFAKLQAAGRNITLKFDIVTNGTLATPKNAELLASIGAHVTVSLDGPAAHNDSARPAKNGKSSTQQTLEGLKNLIAVKDRLGSLSTGSVFGAHYLDIMATYDFLRPLDIDTMKFDFAVGHGDEGASANYVEAMSEVAEKAFELGGERELRRIGMFDHYFQIIDGRKRVRNHCGAGKTHLQVDAKGKLTTCQWFVGEKDEQVGFGTDIQHEKLKEYADPLVETHSCQTCWVRNLCAGGCMYVNKTKTGSKHTKDAAFCTRQRQLIAKGIEKYAEARYTNDGTGA